MILKLANLTLFFTLLTSLCFASAQGRAYKSINFGDSFEVVAQKLKQLEGVYVDNNPITEDKRDAADLLRYASTIQAEIGGVRYYIDFTFYDDKLYLVSFFSQPLTADYFDTQVQDYRGTLLQVITGSQGEADVTSPGRFIDLESSYALWTHVWNTNAEGTDYKLGFAKASSRYTAILQVQWTWMAELIEQGSDQDEQDAIEDSIDDF